MSETVLLAESGRTTGSATARRLRAEDRIPGVVYGHGMDPVSVTVVRRDLRVALSGAAGLNTILDLTVDGEVYPTLSEGHPAPPGEAQCAAPRLHSGQPERRSHRCRASRLEGEAKAVETEGGLVDLTMTELEVVTTPRNIPDEVVIDVSDMDMDTTIRVADIPLPAGVTAAADPEFPVVTVLTMRTPGARRRGSRSRSRRRSASEEGDEGDERRRRWRRLRVS